jgi:hypothetical protein
MKSSSNPDLDVVHDGRADRAYFELGLRLLLGCALVEHNDWAFRCLVDIPPVLRAV